MPELPESLTVIVGDSSNPDGLLDTGDFVVFTGGLGGRRELTQPEAEALGSLFSNSPALLAAASAVVDHAKLFDQAVMIYASCSHGQVVAQSEPARDAIEALALLVGVIKEGIKDLRR